uniref:Uncharacterized protein n=1 Tax=Pararge aegeria TaxID=116150 RepID=S4P1V6_9NEOP
MIMGFMEGYLECIENNTLLFDCDFVCVDFRPVCLSYKVLNLAQGGTLQDMLLPCHTKYLLLTSENRIKKAFVTVTKMIIDTSQEKL